MDAQKFMESDAHWDWWDSYRELTAKSAELQSGMDAYYQNLMKQMLVSEDENTVCSPINLYIAFAMLAETSDGNTRQQTTTPKITGGWMVRKHTMTQRCSGWRNSIMHRPSVGLPDRKR